MQIWKQMIMQEVAHELQTIEESADAQKECFRAEMEIVREQLEEIEVKSARLEMEISLIKAKERKLDQELGKDTLAIKENQAHSTAGQQKSLKNPVETIEEEEVQPSQSPRSKDATPTPQSGQTKNTQKRDYASIAASKPAQAPECP